MTEDLARSYGTLERRISERTRDLEAVRDLLDAFFRISTSQLDPDNIDRTFDSVLRFCSQLGYDLAMISLVDRDAGVIRAARALGAMTGVVEVTVRPLDGNDILAVVVRAGHVIVVSDSRLDPRCDPTAVALSGIRGQVVLPLVSTEVLGTLQVASHSPIDVEGLDLRPLETLASHTARALMGLRQLEQIRWLNQSLEEHANELARSESALREQTRILQLVLDCMGDGVVVADLNARFLVFNPAAQRILGQGRIESSPAEWSRDYEIFLPDRSTPYPVEDLPLMRAIRGEATDQTELYIAFPSRDDGTYILVTGRPLRDENDKLGGGVVVFHDITRRKKSERRLGRSTRRRVCWPRPTHPPRPIFGFSKLSASISTGITGPFGSRLAYPPATLRERMESHRRVDGATVRGLDPKAHLRVALAFLAVFGIMAGLPGFRRLTRDDNSPRRAAAQEGGLRSAFAVPIVLRGECLGVLEFFSHEPRSSDVAMLEMMESLGTQIGQLIERHQMRARVIQSEKLASLGMLSAGVAHEINNPLAYVSNNLAVLERDVRVLAHAAGDLREGRADPDGHRARTGARGKPPRLRIRLGLCQGEHGQDPRSTRQGVKRVADIVQNLRGFARLDQAAVDQADIHEALRTAVEMLRGRLDRRHIAVEQHFGDLPQVAGSPAQLNQVFLNLLVNAMQAIESTHRDDGRIVITTAAGNGEVIVEVADNGCGIPDNVLPQVFDPFFTTKGVGDGTGLGL